MVKLKKSVIIAFAALAVLVSYLANKSAALISQNDMDFLSGLSLVSSDLGSYILQHPGISFTPSAIRAGGIGLMAVLLAFLYYWAAQRNTRLGEEYGSAKWGTPEDIAPLMNPDPDLNIQLSKTEAISLPNLKDFRYNRNKNIVLIGGSGSGKSFSIYKPECMQLHSSYVYTDPKGTVLPDVGWMFLNAGYELRVFNTIDFALSMRYNPLKYIETEADILKVVNVLMENTKEGDKSGGDDIWPKSERMLYTAIIAYMREKLIPEDVTIPTMIDFLSDIEVREDDEEYISPIDALFLELEDEKPDCLAVRQYKKFKQAAGKTAKSILISCGARLSPFDIQEIRDLLSVDELNLDEIGDRKTAFFIIQSDTDSSFSFLTAMVVYQMFNTLCTKADKSPGGKLAYPIQYLLDEFYNVGKIPDFNHLISTVRSRGMGCLIGLQSLQQLDDVYKEAAGGIIDNCDTTIFLGGKSSKTSKEISETLGKGTIDTANTSESHGQQGSWSKQDQKTGRELLTPDEIGRLPRDKCLVQITGLPPFLSDKIDTASHKRWEEIRDGGGPRFDAGQWITELRAKESGVGDEVPIFPWDATEEMSAQQESAAPVSEESTEQE